jgi:hypothetical protein
VNGEVLVALALAGAFGALALAILDHVGLI